MDLSIHLRIVLPAAPWTGGMEDGSVGLPGISWECASEIDNAPDRFLASAEAGCDVGENGVRRLCLDRVAGSAPTAIPVFFGREHMQRNLIVRSDSGLGHPGDLAGKRVGSRLTVQSGTGAGVLMMLEQGYGVDLRRVRWCMRDPESLPENRMGLDLTPGPRSDEEAFQLVLQGALDAAIVTAGPRYWSLFGGDKLEGELAQYAGLRPLVEDPATIAEVYGRTGLYPITDVAVVAPRLAAQHPQLAGRLVEAFSQANALASRYRTPEEQRLAEREIQLLGEDPHQYGLGPNQRSNLAAFIDFLYRLGAIERPLEPEDLFVPSAL